MQRTPPGSTSSSPTPGSSKGKGVGKGASNRNQDPPPHNETIGKSEEESEPGDTLFDNKYAKYSLEEIKISLNGVSRGYGKAKKKFTGFIPQFSAPFNMEIAASMRELIDNLTNFYRTLKLTADAASIIYQHEVLACLHGNDYIIFVDRLTGFICCKKLAKTSSLLMKLTFWFNLLGWPETIRTDGRPQFRSEFDDFCKNFYIHYDMNYLPITIPNQMVSQKPQSKMPSLCLKNAKLHVKTFKDAYLFLETCHLLIVPP